MAITTNKTKSKRKLFQIQEEYETEITYQCPTRGQVTQKIKVKKYESPSYAPSFDVDDELIDQLKNQTLYGESEGV